MYLLVDEWVESMGVHLDALLAAQMAVCLVGMRVRLTATSFYVCEYGKWMSKFERKWMCKNE